MASHVPALVRVFLADDHAVFRDGIKLLLAHEPEFDVVGEAQSLEGLKEQIRLARPDLLLVDHHMPGGDSSALVNHLKHTMGGLRIVFLTGSSSGSVLKQLASVGADAVLLKDCSAAELIAQLRVVMAGGRVVAPRVAELIGQSGELLTQREMQIVKLIGDGLTNAAMADVLSLSPKTVDKHRENLMRKLGVNSAAQLVLKAHGMGWLTH